ncbi:4Fe-4S binding protein [Ignicoccus hospitalis]|uniref:4Fe-4S binding protein n=1 Tax=Ignicoccus hospitalis TaxID=160233 RepID=UPI0016502E89|nr:4Fe-4S binding protein [Ignicoccus hospitalis]
MIKLSDRPSAFDKYPVVKDDVRNALKRGGVVAVGDPEGLTELAKEAKDSFWYRLFLCHDGCPEEVVETLAKLADHWEVHYSVSFQYPRGKVDRRGAIQKLVKEGLKARIVAVPENTFACASPSCRMCKSVCPSNAIRLKEGRVSIDPDKCTSCGLCVAACPLYSLDMPGLAPNELFAAVPPAKAGAAERVVWRTPDTLSPSDFKERTLVVLGIPLRVRIIVEYFTKVLGWEYCDDEGCVRPSKAEPRRCDHSLPEDVSPLVSIKMAYSLEDFYEVVVNPKLCDACTACSEACPTRSLVLRTPTPAMVILTHLPAACVGCHACVRACPVQKKLDALGLNIKMIRVVEGEGECVWKNLVVKRIFRPKCAVCDKFLDVDVDEYINAVERFVERVSRGEFENVFDISSFLNKSEDLLKVLLCKECYSKYKQGVLPPQTVAKLVLLTVGCVYEQEGVRRGWADPVKALWHVASQLEVGGISYCSELNAYKALFGGVEFNLRGGPRQR